VHTLEGLAGPRENLALQSRVVAGARALVCTYGGFSYLGPLLGTSTVAFVAEDVHNPAHADVALRMVRSLRRGGRSPGLVLAGTEDLALLESL